MAEPNGRKPKPGDAWNAESDLAPTRLLEEYEEDGVTVKRYAPGWALGVKPENITAKQHPNGRRLY